MSDETQDRLLLTVTTPLGKDRLWFKSLQGEEQIGGLFYFQVEMLSRWKDLNFDDLVSKRLTVKIEFAPNHVRYINGVITRFVQSGTFVHPNTQARMTRYHAEIRPWLWQLTLTKNCRIFQQLSVPQIIQKVFDDFGLTDYRFSLLYLYEKRTYCVQYEETAFDFVSRLMEDEGIFYFFEHGEDQHTLVIADDLSAHQPCPEISTARFLEVSNQTQPENAVIACQFLQQMTTDNYAIDDFNFEMPRTDLKTSVTARAEHQSSDMRIYEYDAGFDNRSRGEKKVDRRLESHLADYQLLEGQSHCLSFISGYRFTLKDHPRKDFNAEYVLRQVSHSLSFDHYSNTFQAFPKDVSFRPPITTPKPKIISPQTAIVTGPAGEEIYTDKYGRIKVQFHWDQEGKYDENSSCWIRVNQGWAGKTWGQIFIPRIGQEVIISFLNGNPDEPLIIGSVYNAQHMVPYPLPAEQTKSTMKSNSSKGGSGFNEIRFEDKKGQEQIFIHGQGRMDVRVRGSLYETNYGNREVRVGWEKDGEKGGSYNVLVREDRNTLIEGGYYELIEKQLNQTVKEDVVHDFQKNVATIIGEKSELNANEVIIEALQQISLKVGGNFVVIDQTGVYINGVIIKLNSGGSATATGDPTIEDPLEAIPADTGKTGEKSTGRGGGNSRGKRSRKSRTLKSKHAPIVEPKTPEEPRKPPPKPPLPDKDTPCAILSIKATCSHDERSATGGVLEVVSAAYGADVIALEANVQKGCGSHPVWHITSESTKKGQKTQFGAAAPVISKLWIPNISPKVYKIRCEGCNGASQMFEVRAYPDNELSVNLDLNKLLKVVRKITDFLAAVADVAADKFTVKYLQGKINVKAQWKEYDKDYRAFYYYNINAKFSPLIGVEFKITFGPSKITKWAGKIPGLGKYLQKVIDWLIKAGLYFKASSGIGCDFRYHRNSPDQVKFVRNLGTGLSGQMIQLAVGVEGSVLGKDLISIELEASGEIVAKGNIFPDDKGVAFKFEFVFDGLKGNAKVTFLWGIIDVNETVTFIESKNIWKQENPIYLYEN